MLKGVTFMHWNREGKISRTQMKPWALWFGLVWALSSTLTAFILLGLSALLSVGKVSHFTGLLTAASMVSAALGGLCAGNMARNLGWLHGALVGAGYGLFLVLLALGGPEAFKGLDLAGRLGANILFGAGAGVVGVNLPPFGEYRRAR